MKSAFIKFIIIFILYFALIFIIPYIICHVAFPQNNSASYSAEEFTTLKSYVASKGETREFLLEEYLVGVVGAEMPATFPEDALKAQAVAARTHIISKIRSGGNTAPEHHGGDVCTNSSHCKAWKSEEELSASWGENAPEYLEKIKKAVNDTKGEIVVYEGEPISAVYYSMSSGNSENSEDVWGGEVPYLKSVSSSFDANAPGFESVTSFTAEEFKNVIKKENPDADFSALPKEWVKNPILSEGGGVISIDIGGVTFKGTLIRTLFSLRSHNFTITYTPEDVFIFNVKGYGHGVGMSQWGCKFLAEDGKTYTDILKYYYTGVDIVKLT